jgi:hypothetical protein
MARSFIPTFPLAIQNLPNMDGMCYALISHKKGGAK